MCIYVSIAEDITPPAILRKEHHSTGGNRRRLQAFAHGTGRVT